MTSAIPDGSLGHQPEGSKCRLPDEARTRRNGSFRSVRVCFVIDNLDVAGTESQLLMLIRHLDRTKVIPHLCLLNGSGTTSRSLEPTDCPVLRLGVRSLFRPSVIAAAWQFARFLREHKIDVVQPHFADSTYFAVPIARAVGTPHIVLTRRNLGYWMTRYDRWIGRIVQRLSDATIANCEACRLAVVEQDGASLDSVVVVPNGIDLRAFVNIDDSAAANGRPRRVGMVANLRPIKAPDVFVRAAGILSKSYPNVRFQIAGEGDRESTERLAGECGIADRLRLGRVDDVPAFLAGLDVAVLTSHSEGLSNAVLEYMAAGRPIVATAVGGNLELIDDGNTGLLVPPGDPRAVAAAIERLLREPRLARRLGIEARSRVIRRHSPDALARSYEAFYASLRGKWSRDGSRSAANNDSWAKKAATHVETSLDATQPQPQVTNGNAYCVTISSAAAGEISTETRMQWERLLQGSTNLYTLYQSPAWWDHLVATDNAGDLALGLIMNHSAAPSGVVPLQIAPYRLAFTLGKRTLFNLPLKTIILLGGTPLLPQDPTVYDEVFGRLWSTFPQSKAIYLKSVPKGSPCWVYFEENGWRVDGAAVYRPDGIRPFHSIEFPSTFRDYLAGFRSKTRWTLRKKVKRLQEHAEGRLKLVRVESEDQVPEFLKTAAAVCRASWQYRSAGVRLDHDRRQHERMADLARRGILRSYLLHCNGVSCAFVLGYQFHDIFHYSEVGYDQRYAPLSPGIVLLYLLMEDLIEHSDVRRLNFGIGDGDYKRVFANRHWEDTDILLVRHGSTARLPQLAHVAYYAGLRRAKRLLTATGNGRPGKNETTDNGKTHTLATSRGKPRVDV